MCLYVCVSVCVSTRVLLSVCVCVCMFVCAEANCVNCARCTCDEVDMQFSRLVERRCLEGVVVVPALDGAHLCDTWTIDDTDKR